jgi:hypothetical protein
MSEINEDEPFAMANLPPPVRHLRLVSRQRQKSDAARHWLLAGEGRQP